MMSNETLLKFALSNGILDKDAIQKAYEMKLREELLAKHDYKIWQGNDGKWYTYLPDSEKGRILKKRTTEKAIQDLIIKYWKANSEEEKEKEKRKNITLRELYPDWIKYKTAHTNSTSYIKRITADWSRFYTNDELVDKALNKLDKVSLDEWVHNLIKKEKLTKTAYYNMAIIIRQGLDYAVELGYIEKNVFQDVKINTKLFTKAKKKASNTQVYNEFEEEKLINDMFRRFKRHPSSTAPLAVILAFELGLRIGELCALRFSDINGNYISIQRQEVRDFEFIEGDKDCAMKFKEFKIVEYTKTEDGNRDIFLTDSAKTIIELVKQINIINSEPNDSFIFIKDGKNINHYSIQSLIELGCEYVDMLVKTSHKIRKTYVSKLIDSGLNIDEIRRMVGHSDERTTYGNYCFNRLTNTQTEDMIQSALQKDNKVIKGNQEILFFLKNKNPKTL